MKNSALTYLFILILGGECLSLDTLHLFIVCCTSITLNLSKQETKFVIAATFIAISQRPLDWDLEVDWQLYPHSIILTTIYSHLLSQTFSTLYLFLKLTKMSD